MANKMIIDASHPEETRVVVLRGNRVEEFDFESASKKPLRGNIYLAKVTRVEPSLQAAFVEYGGNRHGFLAFSEIHPDYYQIPVADRQALLEDEARQQREEEEDEGRSHRRQRRPRRNSGDRAEKRRNGDDTVAELADEAVAAEVAATNSLDSFGNPDDREASSDAGEVAQTAANEPPSLGFYDETRHETHESPAQSQPEHAASMPPVSVAESADRPADQQAEGAAELAAGEETREIYEAAAGDVETPEDVIESRQPSEGDDESDDEDEDDDEEHEEEHVEQIGGDDIDEVPVRAYRTRKQYKIQEVIKRRQVLLVQVVKEERGNKGAALTTYLSLAGRYSVLMPNTARGGGISRKITDTTDRKRLKSMVQDLEVPEGMGVILRTAGASRTKPEIKRDFEYLLRMWETVREVTLRSTAPTLVYEEGSLIKRSIRDLYNKDIEDISVAGDAGFAEARNFMRLLMPSHVKNVIQWKESQPIFARFGVEAQLDSMFSNQVTLRSGGYIVINQTEALVAIDVNSGRSTREHNIEDTALRTNLEAADEVARQLRLRDLAGLIVVDFIDMEENRNNRAVERRIKEALKNDRARIQVGRISHFGLLEMSRQRMRTGVLEGSTVPCPHCVGTGLVRSVSSIALHVLRVLEDALIKSSTHNMTVRTRMEVALYILNSKRSHLREIERRFGVTINIEADETLTGTVFHALERGEPAVPPVEFDHKANVVQVDSIDMSEFEDIEETEEEEAEEPVEKAESDDEDSEDTEARGSEEEQRRRRRRRRRRGGRPERDQAAFDPSAPQPSDEGLMLAAELGGDLPAQLAPELAPISDGEVDEADAEADAAELESGDQNGARRRRRRGRRPRRDGERSDRNGDVQAVRPPGFWVPSNDGAEAVEQPLSVAEAPAVEVPAPVPAMTFADSYAPAPVSIQTSEPVVAEAPVVPASAPEPVAPPQPEPTPATPEPPPARLIEEPEAAPPSQRKTGWWQRAKATFGGN